LAALTPPRLTKSGAGERGVEPARLEAQEVGQFVGDRLDDLIHRFAGRENLGHPVYPALVVAALGRQVPVTAVDGGWPTMRPTTRRSPVV
jgi:hypothetical protein